MEINNVTRNFHFGSEWIYFKFYMSENISDIFLTEIMSPLIEIFKFNNLIKKWFFIRYLDPDSHIRIRFHLTDVKHISEISVQIHNSLDNYIKNGFVYKIQVDTYKREIERYGIQTIDLCEELFYLNSILNLSIISKYKDSNERFLLGIKFIDEFLNDFGYNFDEKKELIGILKKGFSEEFNANKLINQSLSAKYRNLKNEIKLCLESDQIFFGKIMSQHKNPFQLVLIDLKKISRENYRIVRNDIIDSILHMHCNRLFKTKQRVHEWIVYDFLFRYYEGKLGRLKYTKNIGVS